jgi:protein TonB
MKRVSGNRALLGALAISILAHAAFALFARTIPRAEAAPAPTPDRLQIVHLVPPPTPVPTPKPTVPPLPQPIRPTVPVAIAPKLHLPLPRVASSTGPSAPSEPRVAATSGTVVAGDPNATGTGSPAPPRPACSSPDAPARTISAAPAEAPDGATDLPATADVEVTLDAAGGITDVRIYRSTNDPLLDRAAVRAARGSTYAPALVDCRPAGGTYLFRVDFQN